MTTGRSGGSYDQGAVSEPATDDQRGTDEVGITGRAVKGIECFLAPDRIGVEAWRTGTDRPLTVTDLSRQILDSILGEVAVDIDAGRIRAVKQRTTTP